MTSRYLWTGERTSPRNQIEALGHARTAMSRDMASVDYIVS
jgi:hypothetical protein